MVVVSRDVRAGAVVPLADRVGGEVLEQSGADTEPALAGQDAWRHVRVSRVRTVDEPAPGELAVQLGEDVQIAGRDGAPELLEARCSFVRQDRATHLQPRLQVGVGAREANPDHRTLPPTTITGGSWR